MDLTTTYLGTTLRTPLVPSASPLSEDIDKIKQMEQAGASAVVLLSLFEEQTELDTGAKPEAFQAIAASLRETYADPAQANPLIEQAQQFIAKTSSPR